MLIYLVLELQYDLSNFPLQQLDVAKSELEIYLSQHEGLKKQLIDSRKNLEKATSSIRGGDR